MDAMGTMRDLDQIREHDDPGNSSRLMSIALGGLATACVLFAVGVMVGREAGDGRPVNHDDPLARLDALAHQTEGAAAPVTYPERLVGATPTTAAPTGVSAQAANTTASTAATTAALLDPAARPVLVTTASPLFPVQGVRLVRDGLTVAGAAPTPRAPVVAGTDGAFTVQVSSFRAAGSAQTFAQRLRERGHRAYVSSPATAPNGVVWYRVRVGPFSSQREASAYRGEFEARERMPAIVVHHDPVGDRE